MSGSVLTEIAKMRSSIQSKIDDLYIEMTEMMEELKTMYPVNEKFGIKGSKLSK